MALIANGDDTGDDEVTEGIIGMLAEAYVDPSCADSRRVQDELVARFSDAGHPFPASAVAFATGGSEEAAVALLAELDAPRPATFNRWQGVNVGLLTRRETAQPDPKEDA